MGKFGKVNRIKDEIWNYMLALIGEGGVGKTQTMVKMCHQLLGETGYIHLNIGKESGVDCIDGAVSEPVETYKKWDEVTNDIIKNKETDYPDLKVALIDSIDELAILTEPAVVNMWNKENLGKKDFTPVRTLNQSYGGFGRGEDKVIELINDRLWALRKAGVMPWFIGHVKTREVTDVLSGQTYTTLTTNMMQKYFNAIVKTKVDVLGVAAIDREIVKEKTGQKNIVTKEEKTKNQIVSEARIVKFRDEGFCVDSKSRFANIIDQIPLSPDAFVEAVEDAIKDAKANSMVASTPAPKATKKSTPAPAVVEEEPVETDDLDEDLDTVEEISEFNPEILQDDIRNLNKKGTPEQKAAVKAAIAATGKKLAEIKDQATLEALIAMFD